MNETNQQTKTNHPFLGVGKTIFKYVGIILVFMVSMTNSSHAHASGTTVVSTENMNGWWFFEETSAGSGTFVYGPSTPLLGGGSAQLTVNGTGGIIFGTLAFVGTRLDTITSLAYSTYRVSGSSALAPSLQLDIDTNVTDANTAWQGRLVYEPYYTHTVSTGAWQAWNPLDNAGSGNWWFTGAPGNVACPMNNACTWAEVLAAFPNAGIRSAGANTGALQFKAGSGWTGSFVGNVDAFSIGVNSVISTYDFELPFTVPTITSVSPSSKLTSDSAFALTVNGTNFFPSSVVQWNGSGRTTTFVSSSSITASILTSDLAVAGTSSITVVNGTPGGGTSNTQAFSVMPVPVIPTTLHVIKLVINGSGGTGPGILTPSDFTVHLKNSLGVDVSGSPTLGTSTPGTLYSLSPGTYTVSEDTNISYVESFSVGDCANGSITLAPGDDKICTMVNTDIPAPPPFVPVPANGGGNRGGGGRITPIIAMLMGPLASSTASDSITYNYIVWNAGGIQALTNVLLTDDKCAPVTLLSGDTNGNGKLDTRENWKYSCTTTLSQTTTNTAIAIGHSDDGDNQITIATAIVTVAVDVPVPSPLVAIVKAPSRLTPFPPGGGDVTYTYVVTNPGVVSIHDVSVTDDKCASVSRVSGDTNNNNLLDPSEAWVYTCRTNISISTRNVGTVIGRANGFIALGYAFSTVLVSSVPGLPNTGILASQIREIAANLRVGNRGNDITILQRFLISQNKGSAAGALAQVGATAYFGPLTRAALAEFQASVGISPALGNFGSITRDYVNAHY